MKLLRRCGSLLTFFAALLFFTLGQTSTASATYLVGYLPDYNGSFATYASTINYNKMTEINICFLLPPTCNGTCTGSSNMAFSLNQTDADIATLVNAAHAHGVKVLASIGGAGGDAQIVQFYNAGLSSQLVASLNSYVTSHNLDGVDLDIEEPNNVGSTYSTFVTDCMNTFHPQGKLVTAATAQYISQGNMSNSTLFSFDYLNVMVYSDLSDCQQAVQYYASVGEPSNKIVLGVPFFGYSGNDQPSWASIVAAYPNAGSANSESGGSLDGGAQVTYVGNAEMIQETQLGAQYGGVMIWDLTQDAPAPNSMLALIENNLPAVGSPTPTPTPVVASTWRVVAGGPAHTDCNNNVWAADENFIGGTAATSTDTITGALPCSTDGALYQDQRYGTFSYVFNVPAGSYQVDLKFAETYWTAAGQREFNVAINGTTELTNFDIFATAGGANIAVDKVFSNIAPSGGAITITFGPAAVDNALVSSLQIIPQPGSPTSTPTKTATQTFTPTVTPTATPITLSTWRVVAGGPAHTDCNGNVWSADENFSGGTAATSTNAITGALPCSTDGALYQDQRYGTFNYVFNVPTGNYQVTLKFAETYWTAAGDREFNVAINGTTELTNFDIFATAGAMNKAVDKVFNNIASSGGAITLTFGPASVNYAQVDSIQIVPQPAVGTATSTFSATASNTPTASPTITLTPTASPTGTWTFTPTTSPTVTNTSNATSTSTVTLTPTTSPTGALTSTPVSTFTFTPTFTSSVPNTWRVVAGGPAHTDCNGNLWSADENYSGGTAATSTNSITGALPCSTDGALYQDQRYGTFTYSFPVPAGNYQVTLKFAETYWTAAGDREFNVAINGTTELTNFDIFASAGGQNKAIDKVYNNIAASGGMITITFGPAAVNYAMISAIQIVPQSSVPMATPTFTPTPINWRVVAGGPAHTDCNGNVWSADENYSGGTAATSTNAITGALPCSTDGALYQDQRYGTFTYTFPEPAGNYQVTLKFAETYWTAAGDREFNVSINGTTELTNFDIFKTAGGMNKAIDEVFSNIALTSAGAITVTFGPAAVNYAMVDSIQVIAQPAGGAVANGAKALLVSSGSTATPTPGNPEEKSTPTPTTSPTGTVTLTPTLTNLAGGLLQTAVAAPNVSRNGEPIEFQITLGSAAQVQLSVYNLLGGLVYKDTFEGNAGLNSVRWLLRNQSNAPISSGLYLYTVQASNGASQASKMGKILLFH